MPPNCVVSGKPGVGTSIWSGDNQSIGIAVYRTHKSYDGIVMWIRRDPRRNPGLIRNDSPLGHCIKHSTPYNCPISLCRRDVDKATVALLCFKVW